MGRLSALVERVADSAAGREGVARPVARVGVFSLAGADGRPEIRWLERAILERNMAQKIIVVNDCDGAFRAGTDRGWGLVLVCGHGINAAGFAPDRRHARFPSLGDVSGDWGGGLSVGIAALAAAIRARDGRGPRTSLERSVPQHFGYRTPEAVMRAVERGRLLKSRLGELPAIVFAAAASGDSASQVIIDRLVDELVCMALALSRRLRMSTSDPDIVLAGGLFRTRYPQLFEAVSEGIRSEIPNARLLRLSTPPVAGAVLLGLDMVSRSGVDPRIARLVRSSLAKWSSALESETDGRGQWQHVHSRAG